MGVEKKNDELTKERNALEEMTAELVDRLSEQTRVHRRMQREWQQEEKRLNKEVQRLSDENDELEGALMGDPDFDFEQHLDDHFELLAECLHEDAFATEAAVMLQKRDCSKAAAQPPEDDHHSEDSDDDDGDPSIATQMLPREA